jgi:GNAT superfamily N-acetyltransferase
VAVTSVTIRPGVPDDRDALRGLFRRSTLSNAGDRAVLLANPDVLLWADDSLAEGRTRVAAADDGAVVGFATIQRIGAAVELEDLFVEPGRMRQGVGRRLIEDALRSALADGADCIQVTANPHAMAFYESVGFTHDGVAQTRFGPAPRMRLDVRPPPPSSRPPD